MDLNFILPSLPLKPSGGFRVVFELANRLAATGKHAVTLTFPLNRPKFRMSAVWIRKQLKFHRKRKAVAEGAYLNWFRLSDGVKTEFMDVLDASGLKQADCYIASSWRIAEELLKAPKKRMIHLVQHYEFWSDKIDRINAVCSSDKFAHVCVSRWVAEQVEKLGVPGRQILHLPIGVNTELFRMTNPVDSRQDSSLSFMYHTASWKGSDVVLNALAGLREAGVKYTARAFGTYKLQTDGVEYHFNPSQESIADIYNNSAIFISGSKSEGLGLPPMEAMACGACVVTTDSGGVRDFCVDGENCLMIAPDSQVELQDAITKLIADPALRVRLAKNGHSHITQNFTWERTIREFEAILAGAC